MGVDGSRSHVLAPTISLTNKEIERCGKAGVYEI